jgi:uncharacterized OB-fold protein
MDVPRPLPVVDDRETAGFFEAAAGGRLGVRVCDDCGHGLHVPIAHCNRCGSWNTSWHTACGTGTVCSWTTIVHQVHPAFPAPYTLVLVELDDYPGVKMLGTLAADIAVAAGEPMEVWFEHLDDGVVMPQWRPAGAPTTSTRESMRNP